MRQCWRWFGPGDPISLSDLPMAGVEGVVSALHDLAPGTRWGEDAIATRRGLIEAAGLSWDVVESLPVSEAIKTRGPDAPAHIAAYKDSLRALARAGGPQVVCYNFMPILDWTRTELRRPQPHGGTAMAFDLVDFAVFDLHLLSRTGAESDYPDAVLSAASTRAAEMSASARDMLVHNIVAGLPGANDRWTLDDVRKGLASYDGIDADALRANLGTFLGDVVPVAEELGLRLCCHPDDPPFPLLGLPRIVSSVDDHDWLVATHPSPANGVTFCTGSLGVAPGFDGAAAVERLGPHIHFAHLRNTTRSTSRDPARPHFYEAAHLEGDTDMAATVAALMAEQRRRKAQGRADWNIPMRPDHGQELLCDLGGHSNPGYPLIGRLRGLAELRGLKAALAGQEKTI